MREAIQHLQLAGLFGGLSLRVCVGGIIRPHSRGLQAGQRPELEPDLSGSPRLHVDRIKIVSLSGKLWESSARLCEAAADRDGYLLNAYAIPISRLT